MRRVKHRLAEFILRPATLTEDMRQATDLRVLHAPDGLTVGVRLRRRSAGYHISHPGNFTLRYARASGSETEVSKILAGWGTWLFYGHADAETLDPWMIVDLRVLRYLMRAHPALANGHLPGVCGVIPNGDGTTMLWIERTALPPCCMIGLSHGSAPHDAKALTRFTSPQPKAPPAQGHLL
jgi:hypothetical protein